jgi:tetratricopeptide (TPR) repeat protein
VYLGIFGYRYGYIPDDAVHNPDRLSVTELEYRRALERKIPIVIFIMGEDHPMPKAGEWEMHFTTDVEGKSKLDKLKRELGTNFVVDFFNSPIELGFQIYQTLTELKEKGLVNGTDPQPKPMFNLLPQPPTPHIAHPYILTRQFFGRTHELTLLNGWAQSSYTTMVIDAIGGVGKSALTWEWFHSDQIKQFDGAIWWSFYESDSAVANFIRYTLAYITGKSPQEFDHYSYEDRERLLLGYLKEKKYLLVLDGIERIFVAYHRLDASQVTDDQINDTEERNRRCCTDPRHGELLKKLNECVPSKILISTRLIPADLQDRSGKLLPHVCKHHLNGLSRKDALALIRHLGVYGEDETLAGFMEQFGNHSLLIGVLAGRINDYRPSPGNFEAWYAVEGYALQLGEIDLKQRRTNILQYALKGLSPELRKFLSQIAAFRYPLDYETISAFNPYLSTKPAREAQSQLHIGLSELEDRGLLQWSRETNRYDLHQVVRAYAFEDLKDDDRVSTFQQISNYFEIKQITDLDKVKELHDLHRELEIFYALVGAKLYNRASDIYRDYLRDVLYFRLGAYHTIVELLTSLFEHHSLDNLPMLSPEWRQSTCLTSLGNALYRLGETKRAWSLRERVLKINLDSRDISRIGISLRNYAISLEDEGYLASALEVRQIAKELAAAGDDHDGVAKSNLFLISSYSQLGQWDNVEATYKTFIEETPRYRSTFWLSRAYCYYTEMLFHRGMDVTNALDQARKSAFESENPTSINTVHYLDGELALKNRQFDEALKHFQNMHTLAQKTGTFSDTQKALGATARVYAAQGKALEVEEILIGGIPDLDAAEVHFQLGNHEKASEHAVKAYQWAWADGETFVRHYELQRARELLEKLGTALPSVHTRQKLPIPYKNEILALIQEMGSRNY